MNSFYWWLAGVFSGIAAICIGFVILSIVNVIEGNKKREDAKRAERQKMIDKLNGGKR